MHKSAFLAAIAVLSMSAAAAAAPFAVAPPATDSLVVSVQLRCDHNSCINQRTGEYTESGCNARGCYPSSGVVGRLGPGGEDYKYRSRRPDYGNGEYRPRRRDYGYDERPSRRRNYSAQGFQYERRGW